MSLVGTTTLKDFRADPIAVELAVRGDRPARLHPSELHLAVVRLTAWGLSERQIAERLRCTTRTVERHRALVRRVA
jgi:DNA-binding NarL/FixJ family response regulator